MPWQVQQQWFTIVNSTRAALMASRFQWRRLQQLGRWETLRAPGDFFEAEMIGMCCFSCLDSIYRELSEFLGIWILHFSRNDLKAASLRSAFRSPKTRHVPRVWRHHLRDLNRMVVAWQVAGFIAICLDMYMYVLQPSKSGGEEFGAMTTAL